MSNQIKAVLTSIRADANSPFFVYSDAFEKYLADTYVSTGKVEPATVVVEDNAQVVTRVWKDRETYLLFVADPVVKQEFDTRTKYNSDHNITFFIDYQRA